MLMLMCVRFKMQLKSYNIRNTADNLWCSQSRKVHGSVEVVSSRCPAGPANAVSKASIDHTQVANRYASPPSPSYKGHMA